MIRLNLGHVHKDSRLRQCSCWKDSPRVSREIYKQKTYPEIFKSILLRQQLKTSVRPERLRPEDRERREDPEFHIRGHQTLKEREVSSQCLQAGRPSLLMVRQNTNNIAIHLNKKHR